MAGFTEARERVAAWRRDIASRELVIHQAQERLRQLEARRAALARRFDSRSDADRAQQRELDGQVAAAGAGLDRARRELDGVRHQGTMLADAFEEFSDPRRGLAQLDATLPILLFPVRMETRFKSVPADTGAVDELWVRVYPDDCLVDTFEATPSDSEARNLRRFWIEWAKAGGVREQQRTAWRGLVGGFNAGRAAWLQGLEAYRPVAPASLPTKAQPEDVLLVIPLETAIPAAERGALATYWKAVWIEADDPAAQREAFANLQSAVGAGRAAALVAAFPPANLGDPPLPPFERHAVRVDVVFLEFQPLEELPTQQLTWSQAPAARLLPERFVLLGYRNGTNVFSQLGRPIPPSLAVGPDPSAPAGEQLRHEGGELVIPDDMRWMVDFDTAVQAGMGFRVRLGPDDRARGFDQLMVLGVRLSSDALAAKAELETLIQRHQNGIAGFGLLRTGTATNNTESDAAGFSEREPADASFDLAVGAEPIVPTSDVTMQVDGQWLADTLGIDLSVLDRTMNSRGLDQREARAMNTTLWPGTLGYAMESLMRPVFDEDTVTLTRWFFTHYVTGRGTAPAVRVGRQPYAILPTTRFGAMTWLDSEAWRAPASIVHPPGARPFLRRLAQVLALMREDWSQMASGVEYVGKPGGDPYQRLLDILGLNPASIDFYHRYAQSLEDLVNRLRLVRFTGRIETAIELPAVGDGRELLARLGYTGSAIPELLQKFFLDTPAHLDGPIVDDVLPLSETAPVRAYTPDQRNYLQWLVEAAATSFETLRREDGFIDDTPPRALLYLLLRHALQQGYWDAGVRLHLEAGVLTPAQVTVARVDPSFIHVAPAAGIPAGAAVAVDAPGPDRGPQAKPVYFEAGSESRYHYLYVRESRITGSQETIAEFIPRMLGRSPATRFLDDQLSALRLLTDAPTARLERLLAEHLDLCTYRLDAWRAGLLHYQLSVIRESPGSADARGRPGIYLGAFGWLENVRAEPKQLTPATLPPDLAEGFVSGGSGTPPMQDSANQGHIHAPSLNQAIAAAILRNGYISNASSEEPNPLAVNLTSARVRRALGMIEGVRTGQSLGALLGYRLERELHDQHSFAEVDEFIYELRRAFPLVANQMTETRAHADEPIESIEAHNVVDGLALVEHMRKSGSITYPFGKPLKPVASAGQATAINAAVETLLELHDAVADVAMAESVYQAVLGNYERTGATLDAYSQGGFPPEPEVILTPRSGTTLTHRVALHLRSGLDGRVSPNAMAVTPRVRGEPALNAWLDTHLPDATAVSCRATYVDPVVGADVVVDLTQADLGLQPLDLLYLVNPDTDRAVGALDDLVRDFVIDREGLRPDVRVEIVYFHRYADRYSFFEVGALLTALRRLVLRSRPLKVSDMVLAGEAVRQHDRQSASLAPDRLVEPLAALAAILDAPTADDVTDLAADMAAALADPAAHRAAIVSQAETWAMRYVRLARRAMAFGIAQSGTGAVQDERRAAYSAGLDTLDDVLTRWRTRLDAFDAAVADLASLPSDEERFDRLRAAERLVTTAFTVPGPPTPGAYQALLGTKRAALDDKRALFAGIRRVPPVTVDALIGAIDAAALATPAIDQFDRQALDLTEHRDALVRLAFSVQAQVESLSREVMGRRETCQRLLSDADAAGPGDESVRLRTEAAKALFGPDFVIVPEFSLPSEAGGELRNAWNDRATLLRYLTAEPPAGRGTDFPVDDWLYGIARVREKMQLWEQITLAAEMVQRAAPELSPLQLPFRPDDRWLGMDHPDGYDYEGERLLYTAHFAEPFDRARPQCGLLLDEWTEVIPAKEETTGLAFHYDRPSTEPPQAWLLALSPSMRGGWGWDDLVGSVREAFDEARVRAVEPTQIDRTKYARLLPAVIMAATRHPITIGVDLAANNGVLLGES